MPICTDFIEPLNLRCLLVNTLSESGNIFIGISFIFLASLAAFFRMSNLLFLGLLGFFLILMSFYMDVSAFLFLFVAIGIIIFFYTKAKVWK